MEPSGAGEPSLASYRVVAIAILCAPAIPYLVFAFLQPIRGTEMLLWPSVAAGVLLPTTGLLLYVTLLLRTARAAEGRAARSGRFFTATLVPMALGEAAALLGAMAYGGTRNAWALVPLVTHVLLCIAVWPTRERLESVVEGPAVRS
jgi:hypothetical protein